MCEQKLAIGARKDLGFAKAVISWQEMRNLLSSHFYNNPGYGYQIISN
jgi:hypothetical protein